MGRRASGDRPQGKCNREQTAAARSVLAAVRVKGCGKSAPRLRQRRWHGKPHREQDQIGTATACFRAAVRVGRVRRAARRVPEEWPSLRKKDRTRLTGHLTLYT